MALAIANRYVSALAEVVSRPESGVDPDSVLAQLRGFADVIASSSELRSVLLSPAVSHGNKHRLAESIGQRLGFVKPTRNLIFVLLDNRRIALLPDIVEAFEKWIDEESGVERIRVTSAAPLPDDQRRSLIDRFAGLTGKQVEAAFEVNDALLGGTVVRVGSRIYDGSLAAQLQVLDRAMSGRD